MVREKQWYIVYTKAGNELKTLHALLKKHNECFCLMRRSATPAAHKGIATPLLPNYIFVYALPEEQPGIRLIEGVINFMYWLGECVVVNKEDIFTLKELTENYRNLTAESIKINRVISATKMWENVHTKGSNNMQQEERFIKVAFPAYGFAITAKEDKMNVRIINGNMNKTQPRTLSMEYNK